MIFLCQFIDLLIPLFLTFIDSAKVQSKLKLTTHINVGWYDIHRNNPYRPRDQYIELVNIQCDVHVNGFDMDMSNNNF